jgi:hypothetical protein
MVMIHTLLASAASGLYQSTVNGYGYHALNLFYDRLYSIR